MQAGNLARVVIVVAACAAAVGSGTSNQNSSATQPQYGQQQSSAPPPQQMEPSLALGLWRSTFGAVKIEADNSKGGLPMGAVQGVWTYQRRGQEVIGYFAGTLRGNVLQFRWQEPADPPLTGEGYLVFDLQGHQYSGRWWSDRRDRVGDWNGWRQAPPQNANAYANPYGGQGYGAQQPYPQQPAAYPQQPAYPPQQPAYPQQQYPQQPAPQPQYPQQQYPQQQPQYPPQQPQQPQYPGYPQGYPSR